MQNKKNTKVKSPKEKYDDVVKANLQLIKEGKIDDIADPDDYSSYIVKINGMDILIKQDGLCSKNKIKKFRSKKDEQAEDYDLIRSEMFGVLQWPAYMMSINQMRSNKKYDDRIDLLLNDIFLFYKIVDKKTELTSDVVKKIWESCDLARAYLFPKTFYWLRSFKNFDGFIKNGERDISCFVPNPIGEPWPDTGEGFTKEYYEALLTRIRNYKNIIRWRFTIADIAIAEDNSCEHFFKKSEMFF